MLGKNLTDIVSSMQSTTPRKVTTEKGQIPSFQFSDYPTALRWVRSLARNNSDLFPIEKVLEEVGVSVHLEEMESGELSGYIEKRADGWHIGINKYEVSGRQRFTLAHELAHLLFHRHIIASGRFQEAIKLYRSEDSFVHIEMEANMFAAELLMPSERFRELWETLSLQDISDRFGVSRYAAEFRAKKLRLKEKKA